MCKAPEVIRSLLISLLFIQQRILAHAIHWPAVKRHLFNAALITIRKYTSILLGKIHVNAPPTRNYLWGNHL